MAGGIVQLGLIPVVLKVLGPFFSEQQKKCYDFGQNILLGMGQFSGPVNAGLSCKWAGKIVGYVELC